MHYYSTSNKELKSTLKEAVLSGLAPDRGLYMPASIPVIDRATLESFREMELPGIAVALSRLLFGSDIPEAELSRITEEAVNFDTPLVQVEEGLYALELFHGPTLAFKDVGARFLARLLAYFTRELNNDIHVLVATSGDTGSAVANGFLGVEGTRVHVLYPSGRVTTLQEKQFTTLGSNITALEVDGTFDDCQRLVKEAFMDEELKSRMHVTSANSINLARFLPQAFYYFRAWAQLPPGTEAFFSVPSGNYGNMTGGLVAREMGLPAHTFLSVNNLNDVVASYLLTGKYRPRPSVQTIANAMDVGDPSNFVRILDLFNQNYEWITEHMHGYSVTDKEIRETIAEVHKRRAYLLDPHGATGYRAAQSYRKEHPEMTGIFLETAHPAKFRETVEEVIRMQVDLPERLAAFAKREKEAVFLPPKYPEFREYLLDRI
ncbi:MAG: threonine synthase [Bacteroidota bacterium]|nr:threonine synthase [Bacteroidota bacterium]